MLTDEQVLHIVGFLSTPLLRQVADRGAGTKQTLGAAIARAKFEGGFYKRGMRSPLGSVTPTTKREGHEDGCRPVG